MLADYLFDSEYIRENPIIIANPIHIRSAIALIIIVLVIIYYLINHLRQINEEIINKDSEIRGLESESKDNYRKYEAMKEKHSNLAREYDYKMMETRDLRKANYEYQKDITILLLKKGIDLKEDNNDK